MMVSTGGGLGGHIHDAPSNSDLESIGTGLGPYQENLNGQGLFKTSECVGTLQ